MLAWRAAPNDLLGNNVFYVNVLIRDTMVITLGSTTIVKHIVIVSWCNIDDYEDLEG